MKCRLRLLADDVGVAGVSGSWAERMYSARSRPAHGQELRLPAATPDEQADSGDEIPAEMIADGARLQDLLRTALRRAIEDDDFAEIFRTPENIRARWPVEGWGWRWKFLRHIPRRLARSDVARRLLRVDLKSSVVGRDYSLSSFLLASGEREPVGCEAHRRRSRAAP